MVTQCLLIDLVVSIRKPLFDHEVFKTVESRLKILVSKISLSPPMASSIVCPKAVVLLFLFIVCCFSHCLWGGVAS